MSIRVIGAGLGRTGTFSLKLGLEQLLGSPCYHMHEVFLYPNHVPLWHKAALGESIEWDEILNGFSAAVDWPAASFWPELSVRYPEAKIVLSTRDPESWWKSASTTIFSSIASMPERDPAWFAMVSDMFKNRFTDQISDKEKCLTAYRKHYEYAMANIPKERLVVWNAKNGWGPLCKALDVPVPDQPFPHANTTDEFLARVAAANAS